MTDPLEIVIGRAQLAYARSIDNEHYEQWPHYFVEQCKYVITTDDNYRQGLDIGIIWADSQAMLKDRVTALRKANIFEPHKYRHILSQPYIVKQEGDIIHSETSFCVMRIMADGSTSLFATGRYLDQYRLAEDEIKIKERLVICDSSHFDTLLAIPL